jgi:hypothetical protein
VQAVVVNAGRAACAIGTGYSIPSAALCHASVAHEAHEAHRRHSTAQARTRGCEARVQANANVNAWPGERIERRKKGGRRYGSSEATSSVRTAMNARAEVEL